VLPEGLGFPRSTTGADYLAFYGQLYGRRRADARAAARELLEVVGLGSRGDSLIETYSHGMRQRLGIARALVNEPRVVFLDEPTLGLDPRGQQELLAMIRRIARERDAGVVLSSHLLAEIEGICDDVVIMNAGQIVAKGTVAEVLGQAVGDGTTQKVVRVRVPSEDVDAAVAIVDGTDGSRTVDRDGGNGSELAMERNRLLDSLIRADIPIVGFEVAGGRLQDVFLQLTAEAIA
jgi:ABC-2 type transport system ATP-binding protein